MEEKHVAGLSGELAQMKKHKRGSRKSVAHSVLPLESGLCLHSMWAQFWRLPAGYALGTGENLLRLNLCGDQNSAKSCCEWVLWRCGDCRDSGLSLLS